MLAAQLVRQPLVRFERNLRSITAILSGGLVATIATQPAELTACWPKVFSSFVHDGTVMYKIVN
jgi:hypothetical protein